jgi:hypothetical protein
MIYLHIGTHKTGSSTLQTFLETERRRLGQHGFDVYSGFVLPENHLELYLVPLEPGRDSLALTSLKLGPLPELRAKALEHMGGFRKNRRNPNAIFTNEGLSLLRSPAELKRLRELLNTGDEEVKVILVQRHPSDFLEAYRKQILKVPGRKPSSDPKSSLYVERDSWLADFKQLRSAFEAEFGEVRVVDYDAEVSACGDVLPAVLRAMDLPPALIPAPGTVKRQNASTIVNRARIALYKLLRPLIPLNR